MLFVELRFLWFFALVFGVHWALRSSTQRKAWLLAASYAFYGAWDVDLLSLIAASTLVDFCAGRGIAGATSQGARRGWLALSLTANLGLLGFFKYFNFFAESAAELSRWMGLPVSNWTLAIVLPVGISFYTFQTLSYSLDIYRGKLEPRESFLDLALFVSFFPQLVAGPIVRAVQFLPQLAEPRRWDAHVRARVALVTIASGFFKKAVLSDHLAPVVDQVYADPAAFDAVSTWLAATLFHLQLYLDFSGYSEMAIGLAGLLGYQLPRNFDAPYLARSVTAFWRRWHITLGAWFSQYLYLPLGGSREGSARTYRNLLVVFLVSGLWHGANWTFVVWGLIHGLAVVAERTAPGAVLTRLPRPLALLYVNLVYLFSLVFFRSESIESAGTTLSHMLGGAGAASSHADQGMWWVAAAFFVGHACVARYGLLERAASVPPRAFAVGLGVVTALMLPWVSTAPAPFLYFQF